MSATLKNAGQPDFREARVEDIPQIQEVRHAVRENRLSDPALVSDTDCADYICRRGKGWVCEVGGSIVGFAIADLIGNNIWALFLQPEYEGIGIGKKLHDLMIDWYFTRTTTPLWLSTAPGTRAEGFYRKLGWRETDVTGSGEIRFELKHEAIIL